jgi:hypothetical protein
MPVLKEFLSFFITGFLLAIEFLLVFGMLFAALAVPYAIAIYQLGAMPGSTEIDWALFLGTLLMGGWMFFLIKGGRKKIRRFFSGLIHSTTGK